MRQSRVVLRSLSHGQGTRLRVWAEFSHGQPMRLRTWLSALAEQTGKPVRVVVYVDGPARWGSAWLDEVKAAPVGSWEVQFTVPGGGHG
jgi:hypothetical protein